MHDDADDSLSVRPSREAGPSGEPERAEQR
jgi:hypothetical protein